MVSNMESVVTGEELQNHLANLDENEQQMSEILALRPIENSDFIIAAHLNLDNINLQTNAFTEQAKPFI